MTTDDSPAHGAEPRTSSPGRVAREVESEPAIAATLFGTRIELARAFTHDLATRGEQLGLIGPLELPRLWTRHILNSVLLAPLVRVGRVGDVGTGAGLPGLVLAIARPEVQFVLIEPMERRVEWLRHESSELGLENVEIVRARAEEVQLSPWLDQVTARAVSALPTLIPLVARLVRSGGELLLLKGQNVERELLKSAKAIKKARLSNVSIEVLGDGMATEGTRVFRATVD